jgi:hypothetical protein
MVGKRPVIIYLQNSIDTYTTLYQTTEAYETEKETSTRLQLENLKIGGDETKQKIDELTRLLHTFSLSSMCDGSKSR